MTLSTWYLDEFLIDKYINILKEYENIFGIEDVTIIKRLLIFKKNFLTIHNVIKAIYQRQEKLCLIERF